LSIVSIRRPDETRAIQDEGGAVFWIDADRDVRYQRILKANRGRIDDLVTYEQFCAQEDAEMVPSSEGTMVLNMSGVRDIADGHIENAFRVKQDFNDYLVQRFGL
jgi:hypothetical protein